MTLAARRAIRMGPEGLPEPHESIGYHAAQWASEYLVQPDGPMAGAPWEFTNEQARFLAWWYAFDERGRFIYRYGCLRRLKGWGKDPFAAALSLIEFVGPCRVSGRTEEIDGERYALGEPHHNAWVQIAAVTITQTRNTMTLFPAMISDRLKDEHRIDIGKELVYAHGGRCQIQAVTSSPAPLEGNRVTFQLKNETQHWLANNEGHAMASVIARNLAKSRDGAARALAITNAHQLGQDSDAERDHEAWKAIQRGEALNDMLYDSLEAAEPFDYYDDGQLLEALRAARGDSEWVPVERLLSEMRDPRSDENTDRRFYLNQIRSASASWIRRDEWQECEDEHEVESGAMITLGFDGSRKRDMTALVATEIESGYQWTIRTWAVGDTLAEVPTYEVDQTVEMAMDQYDVVYLAMDPSKWREEMAWWTSKWPDKIVKYEPTQILRMSQLVRAYEDSVRLGHVQHGADPEFEQHILNAVKHKIASRDDDGQQMYYIEKDGSNSPRKIDIAMAAILSWEARRLAIEHGAMERSGLLL